MSLFPVDELRLSLGCQLRKQHHVPTALVVNTWFTFAEQILIFFLREWSLRTIFEVKGTRFLSLWGNGERSAWFCSVARNRKLVRRGASPRQTDDCSATLLQWPCKFHSYCGEGRRGGGLARDTSMPPGEPKLDAHLLSRSWTLDVQLTMDSEAGILNLLCLNLRYETERNDGLIKLNACLVWCLSTKYLRPVFSKNWTN